ncbi:MAG: formylglycine-generating enzyme family protein, partial [Ignavibacteriaceae bacterium]|nr:formylglycine-generating enzyme family protein [Ignavibacteriaceae bacterium]
KDGLQKVCSGSGDNITMNMNANGYRLPTEAEWEYAARGGSQSKGYTYSGSSNAGDIAWYDNNSGSKTHPVGQKQPNELGIYDMSGNVWEWCWDWYGDYSSESQTNPKGPSSGGGRVYRGGSWYFYAGRLRPAYRNYNYPDYRNNSLGFRLLRTK